MERPSISMIVGGKVEIEYESWHTPHPQDPGAVHRAISAAAMDLAMAERIINDLPGKTDHKLADGYTDRARAVTFFAVTKVAERDSCDVDSAIREGGPAHRRVGETPEQSYYRALAELVGLEERS